MDIKSEIEGTAVNIEPVVVKEESLQELRQLLLMHIPSSITKDVRQQFQELILKIFEGNNNLVQKHLDLY